MPLSIATYACWIPVPVTMSRYGLIPHDYGNGHFSQWQAYGSSKIQRTRVLPASRRHEQSQFYAAFTFSCIISLRLRLSKAVKRLMRVLTSFRKCGPMRRISCLVVGRSFPSYAKSSELASPRLPLLVYPFLPLSQLTYMPPNAQHQHTSRKDSITGDKNVTPLQLRGAPPHWHSQRKLPTASINFSRNV